MEDNNYQKVPGGSGGKEEDDAHHMVYNNEDHINHARSTVSATGVDYRNINNSGGEMRLSKQANAESLLSDQVILSPTTGRPLSPGKRLLYVASSPVRYMKKQIRPGGVKSSVFSLIILCLGAGTLSIPYVFYTNGIVFGTFLLLVGALLSIYTGWLVVICCHRLNASRYEEIAMSTYGKKASMITSACMLACLIGFVMSYIVLFKELMPYTISHLNKGRPLPEIIGTGTIGQIFWASIFSFVLVFPVSLARSLAQLRFSSFFSFIISLYIVFAIVCICLFDRTLTPDLGGSFAVGFKNFNISAFGVFNSLPLIIFAYMYQTNIPMIYNELEKKDLKSMWKVMLYGTIGATFAYFLAGVFGYVAFAMRADVRAQMNKQNILKCYPDMTVNFISLFGILTVILFATPLTILPCKDTIEELFLAPDQRLSSKQNILATFVIVLISFGLSLAIPNIGDAMTILGATTNSGIGFLLPIIYYLKLERKLPTWSNKKVTAYIVFVFICISSVIEIATFVYKKIHPEDQN